MLVVCVRLHAHVYTAYICIHFAKVCVNVCTVYICIHIHTYIFLFHVYGGGDEFCIDVCITAVLLSGIRGGGGGGEWPTPPQQKEERSAQTGAQHACLFTNVGVECRNPR